MFRAGSQASVVLTILGDSDVLQSLGATDLKPQSSPEDDCYRGLQLLLNSSCPLIQIILTSMTTKGTPCVCRTEAKSSLCTV